MNKKQLAIFLSKLKVFESPKVMLEQYPTDSEIASDILWVAFMNKNIEGKVIADLGAGPGILGIGALLLGAKKVYFIDFDKDTKKLIEENLQSLNARDRKKAEILNIDVKDFKEKIEIIIQNPPFGVQLKGADTQFLKVAFKLANIVYSMHKTSTSEYIAELAQESGFQAREFSRVKFPIKSTMKHHQKERKLIDVSLWYFKKRDYSSLGINVGISLYRKKNSNRGIS